MFVDMATRDQLHAHAGPCTIVAFAGSRRSESKTRRTLCRVVPVRREVPIGRREGVGRRSRLSGQIHGHAAMRAAGEHGVRLLTAEGDAGALGLDAGEEAQCGDG